MINAWEESRAQSLRGLYAIFMRVRFVSENRVGMKNIASCRGRYSWFSLAVFVVGIAISHAASRPAAKCLRVEVQGDVTSGKPWQIPFGRGWVFRVIPIAPPSPAYSGWDLVVDRDPASGYPDALLLATLPYNSINGREIGTTYGLRAQDAIGWNPRSFRFLTDPVDFRHAIEWFGKLGQLSSHGAPETSKTGSAEVMHQLLQIRSRASSGQFRITDARVVPGIADPQPFARGWALEFARTQHEIEPVITGQEAPQGRLVSIHFVLTLWLPSSWRVAQGIQAVQAPCQE